MAKQALGRGLGAIFGNASVEAAKNSNAAGKPEGTAAVSAVSDAQPDAASRGVTKVRVSLID